MADDTNQLHDSTGAGMNADEQDSTAATDTNIPESIRDDLPPSVRTRDDLQMATDANTATVNPEDTWQKPLVNEDTGEVVVVTFTDISWPKKNDIFTNSLKRTGKQDGKLDFAHYYREVAKEMIVEVNPTVDNLTVWLQGLKTEFGTQLEEELPAPVSDLEAEQEEN